MKLPQKLPEPLMPGAVPGGHPVEGSNRAGAGAHEQGRPAACHLSEACSRSYHRSCLSLSCLVQFLGVTQWRAQTGLVLELMSGGDLLHAISDMDYEWRPQALDIALDVVRGLRYLHSRQIVHCDLKSQNVLLTRQAPKPLHMLLSELLQQMDQPGGGPCSMLVGSSEPSRPLNPPCDAFASTVQAPF